MKYLKAHLCVLLFFICLNVNGQNDTIILGFDNSAGIQTWSSDTTSNGNNSVNQTGYLPNENAASRFLSQATLGHNFAMINNVMTYGIEDWIETEFNKNRPFSLKSKVEEYLDFARTSTNDPLYRVNSTMWDFAFWQYLMTSDDHLRQRVAFALSQLLVISENSTFRNNAFALSSYYDILLDNALGNYRDLLEDITFHPSMGVYLTYMNNPKSDTINNRFPDENYARELMQLFTIGTSKLNMDGTMQYDTSGFPIPTYDNDDIIEYSKIFTGLTWGDRTRWGKGALNDTSYLLDMVMFNDYHEPGPKYLLNGDVVPDQDPVNGDLDIRLTIHNLFNHSNTPPFVCKFLIQRLVTANPPPEYVKRVAEVFVDNGRGERGDMKSVVRAILLDPYANSCDSGDDFDFGDLREPFIRYVQINKAFNVFTPSGNYRNNMGTVFTNTGQRPLSSPSVFNFFQQDYQPIGPVEDNGKVAPVFQITDAQTIAGYINGLYRWIIEANVADESDIYNGEPNANYVNDISELDLIEEYNHYEYDEHHILLDRLNTLLAGGRVSQQSIDVIKNTLKEFPIGTQEERERIVRLAIYLFMTSPEYLIYR